MCDLDVTADQLPYSLTPNQTLALYGVSIPAFYYNGTSVEEVSFSYVGDTFTVYNDYVGTDGTLYFPNMRDDSGFLNPVTKIQNIDFLIYRWSSPAMISEPGTFDFQIRLEQSIDITTTKFQEAIFWSNNNSSRVLRTMGNFVSHYYVYGSSVDECLSDTLAFRPSNSDLSPYYGNVKFALNTIDVGESHGFASEYSCCQFFGSACNVGSVTDDAERLTIGSSVLNIKAASTVIYPQSYDPDTVIYGDWSEPAVYLLIACPVVYGDYTLPDHGSGDYSSGDSGDITVNVDVDLSGVEADLDTIIQNQETMIDNQETVNQYLDGIYTTQTAQLNDIIAKLDDIYDEMVANGEVTVNLDIDASLENQTNALVVGMNTVGQFIVTGIRDLFIPSQSNIINFRLNLEAELCSLFPAVYTSEDDMSDIFYRFASVEAQDKIWFPGVDVSIPDVAANQSTNFQIAGQWVDLKPNDNSTGFHALYEAAALAIDLIATILFFNMLRNKFEGMMKPDGGD